MRMFILGLCAMIGLTLLGAGLMERLARPTVEQSQQLGSVQL